MYLNLVKLCFSLVILDNVLINNNFVYGISSKLANKRPVMKMMPTMPKKDYTKWPKKGKPTAPAMQIKRVASLPPKDFGTPAKIIASWPPKVFSTAAKAAAVPSIPPETKLPSITPAKMIPSFPPEKESPKETQTSEKAPEYEAAAVPSIPPKTKMETFPPKFEKAAIPSIPPKTEMETFPPKFEKAAIPSIPPKTEMETHPPEFEAAAVPSIPPKTAIETLSPEALMPRFPPENGADAAAENIPHNIPTDPDVISDLKTTSGNLATQLLTFMEPLHDNIQGGDSLLSSFAELQDSVGNQGDGYLDKSDTSNSMFIGTYVNYPSYSDVKDLYAHMLGGYDTRVRPKLNQTGVTAVSVFFSLLNILEFKTATQTFDILGYFYFVWEDEFLVWKPSQFSRIRWIKIPMPEIWTPKLTIANMYSGDSKIGDSTDRVLVTYKGKVSWVPEATYKIVCEVEIEFYPFDKQTCSLTVHVSEDMVSDVDIFADVKHNGIRIDHYIENSEWRLVNASVEKYFVDELSYMDVIFVVQRRLEFIFFTIVAPLMLVSILNLCAFLIPVESREKGEFSATIVITYGVFISHICASVPSNSTTIPYFLLYMIWLLGFSVSTVIYSIIQSRLYNHHGKRKIRMGLLTMCFGKKVKSSDGFTERNDDKTTSKVVTNIEEVTDKEHKILLCGDMLKWLDVMMIVLYVLSIIGTSAYFFFSMKLSTLV